MLSPVQMQGILATTGESYMLAVDVRCDAGGCSVIQTEAIPIANYMDEHTEMVVTRMSDLADGTVKLSSTWRAYYAERLALMRAFLLRSGPAPDSVRPESNHLGAGLPESPHGIKTAQ